jgi:DNA (cytosine-5)-methyltransferase 1
MSNKINILDLFSGVGGLSYGFDSMDGYEIVAANEILPKMAKAYTLNFPMTKMYCQDIKDLRTEDLKKDLGVERGDIDLILGGPPCQAYSTVGRRFIDDPRAILYKEYYRVLKELQPKVFLYENVTGLSSMHKRGLLKTIEELFKSVGYMTETKILNAVNYGLPQIRKRIIIVGTRMRSKFEFPKPTHGGSLLPITTLSQAIGDLPSIQAGEEAHAYVGDPKTHYQEYVRQGVTHTLTEHSSPKHNGKLQELISLIPEGGCAWDLEKHHHPTSGFKNSYARLWWDKPSTTITRNLGTPSSTRCIHPRDDRALTTREGARIQGFKDSFKFVGSRSDKNLQIGNAVPPLLSKALAVSLAEHLKI